MKVFELAKELNVESKELLTLLEELDIEVKSHLSALTDKQVDMVKEKINPEAISKSEDTLEIKEKKLTTPKQWKPDLDRMIRVKNIARGKLIYKSKRLMGYTIEWANKGDENYIELAELINLRHTDRRFMTEPWIRIIEDDEVEILKYLNVLNYYEGVLGLNSISEILTLDFESFKKRFNLLPKGYKNTVAIQAAEMIKNGTLDSIKIKNYIEKEMELELDILIGKE